MTRTAFNKSAWIRAQPASMTPKEVVAKAEREGIRLSVAAVYNVRWQTKTARTSASRGMIATSPDRSRPTLDVSSLRKQFQKLTVRLGTDEAQRLLARVTPIVLAQL